MVRYQTPDLLLILQNKIQTQILSSSNIWLTRPCRCVGLSIVLFRHLGTDSPKIILCWKKYRKKWFAYILAFLVSHAPAKLNADFTYYYIISTECKE